MLTSTDVATEVTEYLSSTANAIVVYDGDCPFCSQFVALTKLRESVGTVLLVSGRNDPGLYELLLRAGYDLDKGMVLVYQKELFYGSECMHRLAILSSNKNFFSRVFKPVFSNRIVSRVLYPILVVFRNLTIRALGVGKMGEKHS